MISRRSRLYSSFSASRRVRRSDWNLDELSERLTKLPRLTREVFKFLVERKDDWKSSFSEDFIISEPKPSRIYHGDHLDGDLALLSDAGFMSFNRRGFDRDVDYWSIHWCWLCLLFQSAIHRVHHGSESKFA